MTACTELPFAHLHGCPDSEGQKGMTKEAQP
jgi:hypothetical protein